MAIQDWLWAWGLALFAGFLGYCGDRDPAMAQISGFFAWFTVLVIAGPVIAQRATKRGCLAGAATVGGGFLGLMLGAALTGLHWLPENLAPYLCLVGAMAGVELALGKVSLAVLTLNLGGYWAACLLGVRYTGASLAQFLVLASSGLFLLVPVILLGKLRERRGEEGVKRSLAGLNRLIILSWLGLTAVSGVVTGVSEGNFEPIAMALVFAALAGGYYLWSRPSSTNC